MIQGIIFDLDGTIIHTLPELSYCVNIALENLGLPTYPEENIKQFVGDGMHSLIKKAIDNQKNLSTSDREEIKEKCFQIFWKEYDKKCIESQFFLGVETFLKESPYKLAILTNKSEYFTLKIIQHLNSENYFTHILSGDNPEYKKPNIGGVIKILSDWKLSNREVIFIGDHKTDLETSFKAKIPSVFANYGYGIKGEFKPDYYINEFSGLKHLLKILNS